MMENGDECPKCKQKSMPHWVITEETARMCGNKECMWIEAKPKMLWVHWGGKTYGPFKSVEEARLHGFRL